MSGEFKKEAPAEAGNMDVLVTMRDHYTFALKGPWPGISTPNYALAGLFKMAGDEIEALRAQPPAREDAQRVGGGYDPSDVRYGLHLIANEECDEVAASYYAKKALGHIYTHPAPDALRGAVEALTVARSQAERGADKAGCDGWRSQEMCRQVVQLIDKALDALQAEQDSKS